VRKGNSGRLSDSGDLGQVLVDSVQPEQGEQHSFVDPETRQGQPTGPPVELDQGEGAQRAVGPDGIPVAPGECSQGKPESRVLVGDVAVGPSAECGQPAVEFASGDQHQDIDLERRQSAQPRQARQAVDAHRIPEAGRIVGTRRLGGLADGGGHCLPHRAQAIDQPQIGHGAHVRSTIGRS